MICSHLNPGSVTRMCAGDLEDLRLLVTSATEDVHFHICVDAQTGLGTVVFWPGSCNIGTATTNTHRPEKQRLLECFIMEHLLSLPQTPSGTTMTAMPTYSLANTTAVMNSNRPTASCPQTTVYVRGLWTHRVRLGITGGRQPQYQCSYWRHAFMPEPASLG